MPSTKSGKIDLEMEEWIAVVVQSADRSIEVDGIKLPGLPTEAVQKTFVGNAGRHTLLEASNFYRFVMNCYKEQCGQAPNNLLDFGCGWGRITRFFLRDIPANAIYGIDPQPDIIEVCRATMPCCNFLTTEFAPPLPFRAGQFELAIAYSVFSHLPEMSAGQWIQDLARVIQPGGLLIATTHARRFIENCHALASGEKAPQSNWHKALATSWIGQQPSAATAAYHRGEFVYAPTGGSGKTGRTYGDAIVPAAYVKERWSTFFDVVEFIDVPHRFPQAVMVLERR